MIMDMGHGHHHEPELRKTQAWRHHAGLQSKYENQSEDPSMFFMQGINRIVLLLFSIVDSMCENLFFFFLFILERPNVHDYRPARSHTSIATPYRSHASVYPLWMYHCALLMSIWIWWYVTWRFIKEPSYFFGHAHYPDMSKFTDEELGIPSDDLD